MVLIKNLKCLQSFFFSQTGLEKSICRRSKKETSSSRLQKHQFKKLAELTFFQRGWSMILVKIFKFLHRFFLGKIG